MEPEVVVNLHQLAERTGLPAPWLKAEALGGRLPCLRVGRRLLFNPRAVEQELAKRAAESREVVGA